MVVSKSNSTKRCKSKVNNDDSVLLIRVLVEFELLDEANVLVAIELFFRNQCEVAENVP